jgi:hypothetical protein
MEKPHAVPLGAAGARGYGWAMYAYEWLMQAAMWWIAGVVPAAVWYEGSYRRALGWPFHLLDHLTSRHISRPVWHAITWPLVAIAVMRTLNII